jgi:hypothetical protein
MAQNIELHVSRKLSLGYYLVPKEVQGVLFHVSNDEEETSVYLENSSIIPTLVIEDSELPFFYLSLGSHKEVTIQVDAPVCFIETLSIASNSEISLRFSNDKYLYIKELSGKFSEITSSNNDLLTIGCLRTGLDQIQMISRIFERCFSVFLNLNEIQYSQCLFLENLPHWLYIKAKLSEIHILCAHPYIINTESKIVFYDRSYTKIERSGSGISKNILIVIRRREKDDVQENTRTDTRTQFVLTSEVGVSDVEKIYKNYSMINNLRDKQKKERLPEIMLNDVCYEIREYKDVTESMEVLEENINISDLYISEDSIKKQKRKRDNSEENYEDQQRSNKRFRMELFMELSISDLSLN